MEDHVVTVNKLITSSTHQVTEEELVSAACRFDISFNTNLLVDTLSVGLTLHVLTRMKM